MSNPRIQLSDHFTYPRLLRFVAPSITMMIFTSIYGVVDGFFVSNYIGKTPFAALNFIMPFIMVLGGTGFMLGTGGSARRARSRPPTSPWSRWRCWRVRWCARSRAGGGTR